MVVKGSELQSIMAEYVSRRFPGNRLALDEDGDPVIRINHSDYSGPQIEVELELGREADRETKLDLGIFEDEDEEDGYDY